MAQRACGLQLVANYTEDVVGFALESYLATLYFPEQRFTIEPFSRARERWLGADARLWDAAGAFKPFYMQFKRPTAYPSTSRSAIIKDRNALKLSSSPHALYFALRQKAPNHHDYQHNVLHKLHRRLRARGIGDAAYVCPLFLNRDTYRTALHAVGLQQWVQCRTLDGAAVLISTAAPSHMSFHNVPILTEHVTIPPHASVTDANHCYSFNDRGKEIAFHSPEILHDSSASFAEFLRRIVDPSSRMIPTADSLDVLRLLVGEDRDSKDDEGPLPQPEDLLVESTSPLQNWMQWGDFLEREYGVTQFALVQWGRAND